jgi:hypothetical protein
LATETVREVEVKRRTLIVRDLNERPVVAGGDASYRRKAPIHGGEAMYALTVHNNPAVFPGIADAAMKCLQNSPYQAVRRVLCECDNGILFLRGRLSSFHQKQVAQEAVARVKGVTQVINEIEVG